MHSRSIENDIASTAISFGFNSALSVTIEILTRLFRPPRSARKIAIVEVPGEPPDGLPFRQLLLFVPTQC